MGGELRVKNTLKMALIFVLLFSVFAVSPVLAKKPLVPFKANVTGVAGPPPSGAPPWYMEVYGAGVATHMGKVAVFQSHYVTPTSDPYLLDFSDGVFVWTAANGDELHGTYSGQLQVVSEVLSEIHGTFVIDGGTGRFQSATGGGSASGTQSLVDGSVVLILEGSITY
jgi:hypothetical protein